MLVQDDVLNSHGPGRDPQPSPLKTTTATGGTSKNVDARDLRTEKGFYMAIIFKSLLESRIEDPCPLGLTRNIDSNSVSATLCPIRTTRATTSPKACR